jgi:hypothetical protein
MANPPPGHPHYMSEESRYALTHPEPEEKTMATPASSKYKALKAKMAEAKKLMEETAQKAFTEMSAEFFEDNPSLVSFTWNQFTPYWNDGDVCTFGANCDYPSVTFTASDGKVVSYNENSGNCTDADDFDLDSKPYDKEIKKLVEATGNFLGNFEEEDLKVMFGDHMEITVNRSGKVEKEEYEHE